MRKIIIALIFLIGSLLLPQRGFCKVGVGLFAKKCLTKNRQLVKKSIEYTHIMGTQYKPGILGDKPCRLIHVDNAYKFHWGYNDSPDYLELAKMEKDESIGMHVAVQRIPINIYKKGEIEPRRKLAPGYYAFYLDGDLFEDESKTHAKIWDFAVLDDEMVREVEQEIRDSKKFFTYIMSENYDKLFKLCSYELENVFRNNYKSYEKIGYEGIRDEMIFGILDKLNMRIYDDFWKAARNFTYEFEVGLNLITPDDLFNKMMPYRVSIERGRYTIEGRIEFRQKKIYNPFI